MTGTKRPVSVWIASVLLVALSLLGADSAIGQLSEAETTGQWITTCTQVGYAVAGPVAAGALLLGRSWYRAPLWIWAACITATAGLAPVVWGGAGLTAAFAAGAASAVIAAVVVLLAYRGRAQPARGSG